MSSFWSFFHGHLYLILYIKHWLTLPKLLLLMEGLDLVNYQVRHSYIKVFSLFFTHTYKFSFEIEGPLEGKHKQLRRIRLNLSRMTNTKDSLTDTFNRLWSLATPSVRCQGPNKKKRRREISLDSPDDMIFHSFVDIVDQ